MPRASEQPDTGVIAPSPTAFAPAPVPQMTTTDVAYQTIAVDTRRTPINSLMMHISGSSWTVDYYSQIINSDDPLTAQSTTLDPVFQPYALIRGLELKVKTPLHQQQDDTTKMMTSDGEAYLYVGGNALIPNEGDVLVADIGVGPKAVFRVTSTEKLSYATQAVYAIAYALVSTNEEYFVDLAAKTIKDTTFRKDFLSTGQNPVIETAEVATLDQIEVTLRRLTDQYFKEFFNPEFMTLTVGSQTTAVYDAFLVDFLSKTMRSEDSLYVQKMRVLNVGDDLVMRQDNLWTALLERDATYLKMGFTRTGIVYASEFTRSPWNQSIRYTGIDNVVYPLDPRVGIQGLQTWQIKTLMTSTDAPVWAPLNSPWWGTSETDVDTRPATPPVPAGPPLVDTTGAANLMYPPTNLAGLNVDTQTGAPATIYPVLYDDYYVLSANFYGATDTQSTLEAAVWAYLKGQALDASQLNQTAGLVYQWGVLERFYYVPLLITLLRSYLSDYQG